MSNSKTLIVASLIISLLSFTSVKNMAFARPSPTYGGAILGTGSASGVDDVSTTTLFWGRYISKKIAVENAFIDMGEFSHGEGMDDIAIDLSVLGLKQFGDSTEGYIKGGLHIWNLNDDIGEESSSYLFGLGLNRTFGNKLRARLEWVSYFSSEDEVEDIDILSLGLYVNF